MSSFYLAHIAAEQTKACDEKFKRIMAASSLMGGQASNIYQNIDMFSKVQAIQAPTLNKNQTSQIFFSPRHEAVITAYWGGDSISGELKKELSALSHFKSLLIKLKEMVPESFATHIITASGIGCYYTMDMEAREACYNLPVSSEFDLRQTEPFTIFKKKGLSDVNTQWTDIYQDDVIGGLMMTASAPIYGQKGDFKGSTGIDIPVKNIIRDLTESAFLPGDESQQILFSFFQNKAGKLIAFPKEFLGLLGLDTKSNQFENSSDLLNCSLENSSIESVRNIVPMIRDSDQGIIELEINKEKYFLAVGYLKSVDWQLVLVARPTKMITSVTKIGFVLNESFNSIWKIFIGHSLFVVAISVMSVFCAIRIFISPIKQFIEATQKVATGDFSSTLQTPRKDEIGILARSFNIMIEKLQVSERNEKKHARELENRIKLRTIELENANEELNTVKKELEIIVAKRTTQLKRLNEHMVYTEEFERKSIASDLHDSVTQTLAMSISKLKNIRESDRDMNQGDLPKIQGFLEQAVREIRSLIYQLSPPILDDFDIDIALGFLIEETNAKHHSCFRYINSTNVTIFLDQAVKVTLYRAVNELMTNILKHSGLKEGEIEISNTNESIMVRVEDHGSGFDEEKIKASDSFGFGLRSLSERMENFGGKIIIDSDPGKGTIIHLTSPVSQNTKKIKNENNKNDNSR